MTDASAIENRRTVRSWRRSGGSVIRMILLYTIITIIAFVYILPTLGLSYSLLN